MTVYSPIWSLSSRTRRRTAGGGRWRFRSGKHFRRRNSLSFLVVFQVENKKEEEELEKKLDNLTDKLLGALQTGTQTPEEGQEKSDLGFLWHIFN